MLKYSGSRMILHNYVRFPALIDRPPFPGSGFISQGRNSLPENENRSKGIG